MIGRFPQIKKREERRYILSYWRYLLNWQPKPPDNKAITAERRKHLTDLAKVEVAAYRLYAAHFDKATIHKWPRG